MTSFLTDFRVPWSGKVTHSELSQLNAVVACWRQHCAAADSKDSKSPPSSSSVDTPAQFRLANDKPCFVVEESDFQFAPWLTKLRATAGARSCALLPHAESMLRTICEYQLARRQRWKHERGHKNDATMLTLEELKDWLRVLAALRTDDEQSEALLRRRIRYVESLLNSEIFPPGTRGSAAGSAATPTSSAVSAAAAAVFSVAAQATGTVASSAASSSSAGAESSSAAPWQPTCATMLAVLAFVRKELRLCLQLVRRELAGVSSRELFTQLEHALQNLLQYGTQFAFFSFRNSPSTPSNCSVHALRAASSEADSSQSRFDAVTKCGSGKLIRQLVSCHAFVALFPDLRAVELSALPSDVAPALLALDRKSTRLNSSHT